MGLFFGIIGMLIVLVLLYAGQAWFMEKFMGTKVTSPSLFGNSPKNGMSEKERIDLIIKIDPDGFLEAIKQCESKGLGKSPKVVLREYRRQAAR